MLVAVAKFAPILYFILVVLVFLYAMLGPLVIIGSTFFFAQPRGNQLDPSTDPFHARLLKLWILSIVLFVAMILIMATAFVFGHLPTLRKSGPVPTRVPVLQQTL